MKQKEEGEESHQNATATSSSRREATVGAAVAAAASDTDPDADNKQKNTIRNDNINNINTDDYEDGTTLSSVFVPGKDWTLLSQGAEARVWKVPKYTVPLSSNNNEKASTSTVVTCVCKERFPKSYRHAILDERLTKQRCRMEARLLNKCKKLRQQQPGMTGTSSSIDVPSVLGMQMIQHPPHGRSTTITTALLFLEFIEGTTVRDFINQRVLPHLAAMIECDLPLPQQQQQDDDNDDDTKSIQTKRRRVAPTTTTVPPTNNGATNNGATNNTIPQQQQSAAMAALDWLATEIGGTVAQLHQAGMVHCDLTTSNMMLRQRRSQQRHDPPQQESDALPTSTNPKEAISLLEPPDLIHSQYSLTLIDFGLAKNSTGVEERAVDLYVLERAIQSTHPTLPTSFLETLFAAYMATASSTSNEQQQQSPLSVVANSQKQKRSPHSWQVAKQETLTRLDKVRQRGRKRECFG